MKRLNLLLIILASSTIIVACGISPKKVPDQARTSFEKQYPGVDKVRWTVENGNYEAEFTFKEVETSVLLDPTGKVLETEQEIDPGSLPDSIKNYISEHYPEKNIREAATIVTSEGIKTYEAEIDGKDLIFDPSGNIITK